VLEVRGRPLGSENCGRAAAGRCCEGVLSRDRQEGAPLLVVLVQVVVLGLVLVLGLLRRQRPGGHAVWKELRCRVERRTNARANWRAAAVRQGELWAVRFEAAQHGAHAPQGGIQRRLLSKAGRGAAKQRRALRVYRRAAGRRRQGAQAARRWEAAGRPRGSGARGGHGTRQAEQGRC
jgi:hypothetical protein